MVVILFHAGVPGFAGGYIGVDIFFVISGYLITRLIAAELDRGKFSILVFYERRARRILPALYVVIAASILLAFLTLVPPELRNFGESVGATILFISNILFFNESGYFGPRAHDLPLLHTWSLGVEEQFYVFYPMLLIAVWKYARGAARSWLLGIAIASLVACEIISLFDPEAAFFLLPFRAWELLAGALVAMIERRDGFRSSKVIMLIAMALIAGSLAILDETTRFPSLFAVPVIAGTALMLRYGSGEALWFLKAKPVLAAGLLSYSAYLWHQPLFVFTRKILEREPGTLVMSGLIVLTFLLAGLTWKFVEQPFRHGFVNQHEGRDRRAWIYLAKSTVFSVTLFAIAAILYFGNGLPSRYPKNLQRIMAAMTYEPIAANEHRGGCMTRFEFASFPNIDGCVIDSERGAPEAMIWGDSHSGSLSWGLADTMRGSLLSLTSAGCMPLLTPYFDDIEKCRSNNRFAIEEIARRQPEKVVLHANWTRVPLTEPIDQALARTLDEIIKASPQTRIIVLGGVPQWELALPETIVSSGMPLTEQFRMPADQKLMAQVREADRLLQSASTGKAIFVSIVDDLCNDEGCLALAFDNGQPVPLMYDFAEHVTLEGGRMIARRLKLADL